MALKITLAKVQELVEAAIAEMGADYVYPNAGGPCSYVDDEYDYATNHFVNVKGCIVGHAFLSAIEDLDMEQVKDNSVNDESAPNFVHYLERHGYISIPYEEDEPITRYLTALQQSQDSGQTWGESHEKAKLGLTFESQSGQWENF